MSLFFCSSGELTPSIASRVDSRECHLPIEVPPKAPNNSSSESLDWISDHLNTTFKSPSPVIHKRLSIRTPTKARSSATSHSIVSTVAVYEALNQSEWAHFDDDLNEGAERRQVQKLSHPLLVTTSKRLGRCASAWRTLYLARHFRRQKLQRKWFSCWCAAVRDAAGRIAPRLTVRVWQIQPQDGQVCRAVETGCAF